MTQRLSIACAKPPLDLFFSLRDSNPSPFGAYLDYDDFQIVCASPERFLQMISCAASFVKPSASNILS